MPFRRTYRRYSKSRKLSKSNILSNRGAKAQSKQIAALNRKVNYIARVNRPEILIKFYNDEHTFTNGTLSQNWHSFGLNPYQNTYTGDDDAVDGSEINGNFNRCKGISLKCIAQFSDNWRDTIADEAHDPSAGYRIVILQLRRATPIGGNETFGMGAVFNSTSTLSSSDTNLTMPLVPGISQTFKVLYSKVFTINRYHPTRIHNINIPESKCLNFSKEVFMTSDVSTLPKGHIIVMFLTGGLHNDIDYTAQIKIASTLKLAYTDN